MKITRNIIEHIVSLLGENYTNMINDVYNFNKSFKEMMLNENKNERLTIGLKNDLEKYVNNEVFEKRLIGVTIKSDIAKSVGHYLLENDELKNVNIGTSMGKYLISFLVSRNGYPIGGLTTEVIRAGGHNIQTLHYRMITKTDLSKVNGEIVLKWSERAKKVSKVNVLIFEKEMKEKAIIHNNDRIETIKSNIDKIPEINEFIELFITTLNNTGEVRIDYKSLNVVCYGEKLYYSDGEKVYDGLSESFLDSKDLKSESDYIKYVDKMNRKTLKKYHKIPSLYIKDYEKDNVRLNNELVIINEKLNEIKTFN